MMRSARLLPALLSALLLVACNDAGAPADAGAATTEAAGDSAATGTPGAEAQAAAESAAAAAGAAMAGETGQPATAAEDAATAPAEGATALVEGTDYEVIRNGQPWMPLNGKIEVVEVFGYVCPACFRLAPIFAQWKAGLPPDVRVSYVPAPFGAQWTPYAKAYFAAESLGLVDRTHDAMFSAIHIENVLPGEGETPDPDAVAKWYGQHGGNAAQFRAAMDSFATDAKVNRGKQWMARSGVGGTPTIIVNGKYRITGGRSYQDVLHIADQLIAMERAAGASAGS